MLPKSRRLFRQDFLVAKFHGKTHRSTHFSLIIHPNQRGYSRISVVTSAKLDKRAVIRNKLRRRIYDCFKDFTTGADIIVFPFKSALLLTPEQLKTELWQALKQVTNT
ncbi:ribonuclease P protein component [Candidatus Amesbacteria bacterium]|nr:ribonuclease P protein component [Candidatus Amesbacteria bacterium]